MHSSFFIVPPQVVVAVSPDDKSRPTQYNVAALIPESPDSIEIQWHDCHFKHPTSQQAAASYQLWYLPSYIFKNDDPGEGAIKKGCLVGQNYRGFRVLVGRVSYPDHRNNLVDGLTWQ